MTRYLLPLFALLLLLLSGCPAGGDGIIDGDDDDSVVLDDDDAVDDDDDFTPTFPEDFEVVTSDGLTIKGLFQSAEGVEVAPAVLLLHEIARDRADYNAVFIDFVQAGISPLAIDFRGHGTSDDAAIPIADLQTDPSELHHDVVAALEWLAARDDVDASRIGVMGLDVGASMAVVALHNRATWGVKSICAVSPIRAHVDALAGTDQLDLENALYVAAELNIEDLADAQGLFDITVDPRDIEPVGQTDDHGFNLLTGSVDAQNGTVNWFVEALEEE
jgi:dienelactone hydrolase